jgi:UDP-GlcNAc:undecaprenyl-phosphate GlcNAc-1-phosphate transferase
VIFAFLVSGLLLSWMTNSLLLRFSQSLGIRNKNDVVIRWSNHSKPSLGGVSFFVVFIFSAIAFLIAGTNDNFFKTYEYIGFFSAASLAFLMGLADDAYNTKPLLKLFVQIICGLLFCLTGTIIELTHVYVIDAVVTVLWVVVIMNSLNMLDNMDGITGSTVLFVLLTCLFGAWIINGLVWDIWIITLVSMIGGVLGFLYFNVHPSKLFMGDAGSQFIGLFVAFFAVKFLWNIGPITQNHSWTGIVLALTAFTPAAADTLTVVINRLRRGQSPMVGGKDHTTHHLVYSGMKDRQVWYVFSLIGACSFLLSLGIIILVDLDLIVPVAFAPLYFLLVFLLLYRNTIRYPEPKR